MIWLKGVLYVRERVKSIIGSKRGLALAIKENGCIGFYKIWIGFNDNLEGTVCEFHKESSIKVEGNYEKTYDNVMEVLVESSMMMFNTELNEDEVLKLLEGKSFDNVKAKSLYTGYTEIVISDKEFGLFLY